MTILTQDMACIDGQSTCFSSLENGHLFYQFDVSHLLAETPFNFQVFAEGVDVIAVEGYMEGDDMFMGKIPLFFQETLGGIEQNKVQDHRIFRAESLFGSCSEAKMTWRVWLTVKYQKDNVINELNKSFTVTSYRNSRAIEDNQSR
ncbi:hypothetical protein ACFSJY_10040 [Thalassotalea euphylliae]|uniref:hypothetical protein n=1 Tax=Thalassotalea euphylliae TaxID=1655234 RepID=UPI003638232F